MAAREKLLQKLHRGSRLSSQEVRKLLKILDYVLVRPKGSHGKEVPHYILDALRNLVEQAYGKQEKD